MDSLVKSQKKGRRSKMKKSSMLILLVVVLVAILPLNVFSQGKPIELRLAHMFPVASPSHQHIENWAKKIAADSNGQLTIRIFPVNTLLNAPEIYDGVANGAADIGFSFRYKPENYTLGVTFPFILGAPNTYVAGRVYDDVWKKFPKQMAEDWKEVKILWLAPSMFQAIQTKKAVRRLEDIKGMQIRVPSKELGDLMKDLGATPVFMSTADFVIGIEKGTVDGAVIQPGAVHDNKLGGKIKFILELSLGVPMPVMAIMNKDSFNKLPPDLQSIIDKSCEFGKEGTAKFWAEAYENALKYYKAEGVEVVRLSPEEKARWVPIIERARDRVGADLDAKGVPGTEIVRFIRERIEYYAR
jgi:TRAP-type C4-dicarboxylate transport system substrate-binding protein